VPPIVRMDASAVNQTGILVGDSESFTLKWRRRAGLGESAAGVAITESGSFLDYLAHFAPANATAALTRRRREFRSGKNLPPQTGFELMTFWLTVLVLDYTDSPLRRTGETAQRAWFLARSSATSTAGSFCLSSR
jgi:hypothetical protein